MGNRKESRTLKLFLLATVLTALTAHAAAQDKEPKVEVFIPSLEGSWIKTIPSASSDIVLAPDGKTFAMNCQDLTVRVLRAEYGHEVSTIKLRGAKAGAKTLAYSPDGTKLATARHYNHRTEIQVWNPTDGKQLWRQVINESCPGQLGFRTNEDLVRYTATRIYELSLKTKERTFQELMPEPRDSSFGAISNLVRNGSRIEFACAYNGLQVYDLAAGRKMREHKEVLPIGFNVRSITLSPECDRIAIVSQMTRLVRQVDMWDARTGKPLWTKQLERNYPLTAAFSPNGRYLATAGMHVRLAESDNPGEPPYGWSRSGFYDRNGRIVWTSRTASFRSSHNAILLWDVATGAIKKAILHPEYHVVGMTFTADGTGLLVTGSENRKTTAGPKSSSVVAKLSLVGAFADSKK